MVFKPGTTDTSEHFAQQRVGKEVTGYVLKTEHERSGCACERIQGLIMLCKLQDDLQRGCRQCDGYQRQQHLLLPDCRA